MPFDNASKHQRNLQATLADMQELLKKQELVSELAKRQQKNQPELVQTLIQKQQQAVLQRKLNQLHPADVAYVLEGVPLNQRMRLWSLLEPQRRGAALLETADAVRRQLIDAMQQNDIVDAVEELDSDEIADLVPCLPKDTVLEVLNKLDHKNRTEVDEVLKFPEGTVGALMDFDMATVREDMSLETVLGYVRKSKALPEAADQFLVVDNAGILKGSLPLRSLLLHPPETTVAQAMTAVPISFYTDDDARDAVLAFERYDLISVPVVNTHHQLVGKLSVDRAVAYLQTSAQQERLIQVGLKEADLFAPVWRSARNRWRWLALNLLTAFFASRIIGAFENTIEQLVALAALLPIVASMSGNTGNQTVALMIRGLALNQINRANLWHMVAKEIGVSLINGVLWGAVVGGFAYAFYRQPPLSLLMAVAMLLSLLISACAGILIPLLLDKLGQDPVLGSSIMLTAVTDATGFFLLLGLASYWLF